MQNVDISRYLQEEATLLSSYLTYRNFVLFAGSFDQRMEEVKVSYLVSQSPEAAANSCVKTDFCEALTEDGAGRVYKYHKIDLNRINFDNATDFTTLITLNPFLRSTSKRGQK